MHVLMSLHVQSISHSQVQHMPKPISLAFLHFFYLLFVPTPSKTLLYQEALMNYQVQVILSNHHLS